MFGSCSKVAALSVGGVEQPPPDEHFSHPSKLQSKRYRALTPPWETLRGGKPRPMSVARKMGRGQGDRSVTSGRHRKKKKKNMLERVIRGSGEAV